MLKVLGIGNHLRGDDSVGPLVIEKLKQLHLTVPVVLFDLGGDPFSLLEHLLDSTPIIIIDCAKMGKKPGEVVQFHLKESKIKIMDQVVSLHSLGFYEIYQMAKGIGPVADCQIIGVEPKSIEYNAALSPEVENSVSKIIEVIIKEAKYYAQKDFNN
jgi:hydrogenase maturation protease